MLRITKINENENTLRLRLDGRIDAESYAELAASWTRSTEQTAATLVLDMSGVVYMSDEAARKLTSRRGDRFDIVNCSPFIAMLLDSVSTETGL